MTNAGKPSEPSKVVQGSARKTSASELRRLAHLARIMELRDYDWMNLDYNTAMKIHTLLPRETEKPSRGHRGNILASNGDPRASPELTHAPGLTGRSQGT